MTPTNETPGINETPGYVESPVGPLFVVESARPGEHRGAVIVSGGGWLGTGTNRNAVLVRMARKLASSGFRVARFDWRGTGESGGVLERFDLETPFGEDVGAVIRHLESRRGGPLALTGICFGSVSALAAARQHQSVTQLALISLPFPSRMTKADHKADRIDLKSMFEMARKPATWATLLRNAAMRQAVFKALKRKVLRTSSRGASIPSGSRGVDTAVMVEELTQRGVRIDLIFGDGDLEYASYRAYVERAPLPPWVNVKVVPGDLSNFGTIAAQNAAIELVVAAITSE